MSEFPYEYPLLDNNNINTVLVKDYILDPYQYQISQIKFDNNKASTQGFDYYNNTGLVVENIYDLDRKSAKDISAKSYNRFLNGEYGNFSVDNSTLWYHGGISKGGAAMNVQEPNYIILNEPQRGGLNTTQLVKYTTDDTCKLFDFNKRNDTLLKYYDDVFESNTNLLIENSNINGSIDYDIFNREYIKKNVYLQNNNINNN